VVRPPGRVAGSLAAPPGAGALGQKPRRTGLLGSGVVVPSAAEVRSQPMETVNGCTIVSPTEATGPVRFGPAEMDGAYVVEVGVFPAGGPSPPLHVHPYTDESFYVAEGEATFLLGDRERRVSGGTPVFVPRGTAHTVWNSGDGPVLGLIVISPGDAEHVFQPVDAG